MKAKEIMTQIPACHAPETNLQKIARMTVDCNCGEIPVVESRQTMKPVGVVTDRGIACRAVAHSQPRRILVADDHGDIRELSTEVLAQSGYEANAAEDGAAAWKALQAQSYDLLITDHDMPHVTGVELLKKIRAARMPLPVILASGSLPPGELERHLWLQPVVTLRKPYTVSEYLEKVQEVLQGADRAHADR